MNIDVMLEAIENLFLELGFKKVKINNRYNYVYKSLYCELNYSDNLGFVIEYANSLAEAEKSIYDDGDVFSPDIGESAILTGIKAEVEKEMVDVVVEKTTVVPYFIPATSNQLRQAQ